MSYSFGDWIKKRRKTLDLTQKDLARLVGCSASLIYKIESDQRRPSRQIAELIAERLEVPDDQRELFLNIARQKKNITNLKNLTPLTPLESVAESDPAYRKLPSSPTPFIGRETEIKMISNQLLDPACRMVTLTGPGGYGKTRLAIQVGSKLEPQFPDGVIFVSLVGIERTESLLPAIADSLGLTFSGNAAPIVQVTNFLRSKNMLVVIDNMEHLIEASSVIGEILARTQHVKMIITSREHLNLQWEWLFEIQGLPIPKEAAENITHNSAVKLFLERARQARYDFSLPENVEAVIRICQLVGGSPLAIELAASWVRLLSCTEIAEELDRSLDLLETSKQDIPQRHRSIKSVFEHSWELLQEEDRNLLMTLSVFQGGFTREAAAAVAGASLKGLSSLTNKSLLRYNKELDRYDLHDLIRQYSFAKLQARPAKEAEISRSHALYFASWLTELEGRLKSMEQLQIAKLIRSESANWLASYYWIIENQRLEILRKMSPSLNWYFEIHGYFDDALAIIRTALTKFRSRGVPDSLKHNDERSAFAFLLNQVGWFEFRKGNVKVGSALFAESLKISDQIDDPEVLYYIHVNWGYLSNFTGDFNAAERFSSESLQYARQLNPWHLAVSLSVLGIALYNQGSLTEAYEKFNESLGIWRSIGDPRGLCYCFVHMALVTLALNKITETETIMQESNQIAAHNNDRWSYAFGLDILGLVSLTKGKYEEALAYFEDGKKHASEIGDRFVLLYFAVHKAQAYTGLGSIEEAKHFLSEAYREAVQSNWTLIILNVLVSFIEIKGELPPDQILAAALSILAHPGINPEIHDRCVRLRDESLAVLGAQQAAEAEQLAKDRSAEEWAEILLR